MELDALAADAGWATTDVQEVRAQPDFPGHVHEDDSTIAAPAGGVSLKFDVEETSGLADSGDPEQDLTDLLREIGAVAGALFLTDEMHNLDASSLAAICIAFQAISRGGLPVAMAAAGLPDLAVRLISAKPYADRLFQYHGLGRLAPAATRTGLVAPGSVRGLGLRRARRGGRRGGVSVLPAGVRPRALEQRRGLPGIGR